MDLCWQSDVSAFKYALQVCHSCSSKEQASFIFMAAITVLNDFWVQENKICHWLHFFPFYLSWRNGTGCHDLCFLNGEFRANFSFFSFTFIRRLFSFSLLSAIRMVSSAYPSLLIFLLAILIPACALSSLAFHMMYFPYKLNKQGDNIQP